MLGHRATSAARPRSHVDPAAIRATCSSTCASKGFTFLASLHGVDYYPEEPRLGVHYELLDMDERRPHLRSSCASRIDAPHVPIA